jgi:hypothetical protein
MIENHWPSLAPTKCNAQTATYLHGYTRTIQQHDDTRQVLSQEEKNMKAY